MTTSRVAPRVSVVLSDRYPISWYPSQDPHYKVAAADVIDVRRTTGRAGLENVARFRRRGNFGPSETVLHGSPENHITKRCAIYQNSHGAALASSELIHYGRVVNWSVERFPDGEDGVWTSRLDSHMIGNPVSGMVTLKRRSGALPINVLSLTKLLIDEATIGGDIVFNPIIDGVVVPNRSYWSSDEFNAVPFFVDPAQIPREYFTKHHSQPSFTGGLVGFVQREARAVDLFKYGVAYWTLSSAIYYLCWTLNSQQIHVKNPWTMHEINEALGEDGELRIDDGQYLTGTTIPQGTDFVDALRLICEPWGIDFRIRYDLATGPELQFFVNPHFQPMTVPISAIGSALRLEHDAVPQADISIDVVDRNANEIYVVGSIPKFEVTLPLFPAWPPSQDSLNRGDLVLGNATSQANPRAYREWAANESAEYTYYERAPYTATVPDFEHVMNYLASSEMDWVTQTVVRNLWFGWIFDHRVSFPYVERRRRALPMLTSQPNGVPLGDLRGTQVEYVNLGSDPPWPPRGKAWNQLPWRPIQELTGDVDLLQHEIGIRFTGRLPPFQQWQADASEGSRLNNRFLMRITCTVEADGPIAYLAQSMTPAEATRRDVDFHRHTMRFLDQFGYAVLVKNGDLASQHAEEVASGYKFARTRDDLAQMVRMANEALSKFASATCKGNLQIAYPDWHATNVDGTRIADALGSTVTSIPGRNFSLNMADNEVHDISQFNLAADNLQYRDKKSLFPVVVGMVYSYGTPAQTLILDRFRGRPRA